MDIILRTLVSNVATYILTVNNNIEVTYVDVTFLLERYLGDCWREYNRHINIELMTKFDEILDRHIFCNLRCMLIWLRLCTRFTLHIVLYNHSVDLHEIQMIPNSNVRNFRLSQFITNIVAIIDFGPTYCFEHIPGYTSILLSDMNAYIDDGYQ